MEINKNYYTVTEAAELLGITRQTVANMIKDGRLKTKKYPKVRKHFITADSLKQWK